MNIKAALMLTATRERLDVVDMLRGFALFGILLVNSVQYAYGSKTVTLPVPANTAVLDVFAIWFIRFLGEGKFYFLFSFLFGLGFSLQLARAQETQRVGFWRWYVRRLLILLGFGLMHALLIWTGDILVLYSLLGFALILFRKMQPRRLLFWAVGFLILTQLIQVAFTVGFTIASNNPEFAAEFSPNALNQLLVEQTERERAIFPNGDFWQITQLRINDYFGIVIALVSFAPNVLALFLLGMYVGKRGLLRDAQTHVALYRWLVRVGLPIGVIFSVIYATLSLSVPRASFTWNTIALSLSQVVGALGFLAVFVGGFGLLAQHPQPAWRPRLRLLALTGRMALTNYLTQSIICTTLFYGYGFGLFAQFSYAGCVLIAVILYSAQVAFSNIWMQRFAYGPLEWLWRSLSYGTFQTMQLARPQSALSPQPSERS